MNLSPERQKKADALGLPYTTGGENCLFDNTGGEMAFNQFAFAADSANRVLQLEQAVEELRKAIDYSLSHTPCDETDSVMEEALKQTENL